MIIWLIKLDIIYIQHYTESWVIIKQTIIQPTVDLLYSIYRFTSVWCSSKTLKKNCWWNKIQFNLIEFNLIILFYFIFHMLYFVCWWPQPTFNLLNQLLQKDYVGWPKFFHQQTLTCQHGNLCRVFHYTGEERLPGHLGAHGPRIKSVISRKVPLQPACLSQTVRAPHL